VCSPSRRATDPAIAQRAREERKRKGLDARLECVELSLELVEHEVTDQRNWPSSWTATFVCHDDPIGLTARLDASGR
jgi:hypothetical protein